MAGEEVQPNERRPWYEPYTTRPWLPIAPAVVCGLALLVLGVAFGGGSPDHLLPLGTWITGTVVAAAALGQLAVARRRHEEQTKADIQRRVTESFTKAVEQLESDKLQVRLSGIYTLERISRESPGDYWNVMETLAAFVRQRAPWREGTQKGSEGEGGDASQETPYERHRRSFIQYGHKPPVDVAAVLTVIGRRDPRNFDRERRNEWFVDLSLCDLRGADLSWTLAI